MKSSRQDAILEIIEKYEIDTQDALIARLRERGFDVTQATISRDIRELQLTKIPTGRGTYRYIPQQRDSEEAESKIHHVLISSILSMEAAMNIVVIKTNPGLAQAVAAGIDSLHMPEIVGCVAGDDTLLTVTHSKEEADIVCDKLREFERGV